MVEVKLYVLEKAFDVEHRNRKGSRCTVNIARCPFSIDSFSSSVSGLNERAYQAKTLIWRT